MTRPGEAALPGAVAFQKGGSQPLTICRDRTLFPSSNILPRSPLTKAKRKPEGRRAPLFGVEKVGKRPKAIQHGAVS